MVLYIVCFVVSFFTVFAFRVSWRFLFRFMYLGAHRLVRAAHSVKRRFSFMFICILVVSHFGFKGETVVVITSVPSHCLSFTIRITCLCNVHPLTPHFYIVKLGFIGVYIFFLCLL